MTLTPSNMLPLGTSAKGFHLVDTISGEMLNKDSIKGERGFLVMFICNHCPFVLHLENALISLEKKYDSKQLGIVAISANDPSSYPEDSPAEMAKKNYPFPYLFDKTQSVAKDYGATCTPDFFLYDEQEKLVYRGQFDNSRPGNNEPVSGLDLTKAIDALINGDEISHVQKPSVGCNIKWKSE